MKKITILAVVCALVLVSAGAYVVMVDNSAPDRAANLTDDPGNDGNETEEPSGNSSLDVRYPVNVTEEDAVITLSLQGLSGSTFEWSRAYALNLTSTVLGSYEGRVLTKVFAVRTDNIGEKCIIVTPSGASPLEWDLSQKDGRNVISGDLGNWTSTGTGGNISAFTLVFNRTGTFDLFFQAFDLDTGEALSVPLEVGPLDVPVEGSLTFETKGEGSFRTDENGTFYTVLLNVTNDWNTRYVVEGASLVLSDGSKEVGADLNAMSFENQSLAPGQSTQFMAYFKISGDPSDFKLEYRDQVSGMTIQIPLD